MTLSMPVLDEKLLDAKLGELEKLRTWSPRVISKLESFLRSEDEWALFRVNPYYFASERGVAEDEAVDLFLFASKVGLFHMSWNLLCPGCGAAVESFASLKSVSSVFRCHLCAVDVETRLDDYVHVGFTVAPAVRRIAAHDPKTLSAEDLHLRYHFTRESRVEPGGPRMVDMIPALSLGMRLLDPGETASFEVTLEAGALAIHNIETNELFPLLIEPGQAPAAATLKFVLRPTVLPPVPTRVGPGKATIEVTNSHPRRSPLLLLMKPQAQIDEANARIAEGKSANMALDRFLTGRRLLSSNVFRQIFGNETIRGSEGIGVRDVSILFTDLKGSTSMYDRIGDLKAFALVNQHFERLGRAITEHRGAVVKTIGDAVMASFEQPADAVRAAREMLGEIREFNREGGEGKIILKVGIHRGASIAVTLNDRLDYFGQTVNIAARVQALADADEIYVTEEIFSEPGVAELVRELHVTPHDVRLKGVERTVRVFRLGMTAPAI